MTTSIYDNTTYQNPGNNSAGVALAVLKPQEVPESEFSWDTPDHHDRSTKTARRGKAIRKQDIAEITSQLAIMTRSGVDIASAITSLAAQCQRPDLAAVLSQVREAVLSGNTLSEALKQHPEAFDGSFVATVAAGEASGKMAQVLQQLAQMQRNQIRSARAMRSVMTYPILLMCISLSVVTALVIFVLPKFSEIFAQYEVPLPIITQLLIAVAAELRSRWWLWAPLLMASIVALWTWRNSATGRQTLDRIWINTVGVRDICRTLLVGRTCRLLGLMLDSGVPLLDSLRFSRQAVNNMLFKNMLAELEEAVVNGRSLASALETTDILPRSASEMIITAEKTGNLGEVTRLLGEYYEEEAEARVRQLAGILEPLITVVMGVVVAIVVLAVMLPVFDLSTFASRGR